MERIKFVSKLKGLSNLMPIVEAKEIGREWTKKAKEDYLRVKELFTDFDHPYRCPGMFELMKTGYIVRAWFDFTIKTMPDNPGFKWEVKKETIGPRNLIDTHTNDIMSLIPRSPNTLKSIIKIHTPWNVVAPKGLKFIFLPITYPDHFEFSNVMGILDPTLSKEINIQLDWHILEGEHTVKSGTPLGQLVPLTEKSYEMICQDEEK